MTVAQPNESTVESKSLSTVLLLLPGSSNIPAVGTLQQPVTLCVYAPQLPHSVSSSLGGGVRLVDIMRLYQGIDLYISHNNKFLPDNF